MNTKAKVNDHKLSHLCWNDWTGAPNAVTGTVSDISNVWTKQNIKKMFSDMAWTIKLPKYHVASIKTCDMHRLFPRFKNIVFLNSYCMTLIVCLLMLLFVRNVLKNTTSIDYVWCSHPICFRLTGRNFAILTLKGQL